MKNSEETETSTARIMPVKQTLTPIIFSDLESIREIEQTKTPECVTTADKTRKPKTTTQIHGV